MHYAYLIYAGHGAATSSERSYIMSEDDPNAHLPSFAIILTERERKWLRWWQEVSRKHQDIINAFQLSAQQLHVQPTIDRQTCIACQGDGEIPSGDTVIDCPHCDGRGVFLIAD